MITRRGFLKVAAAGGALASIGHVAEAKNKLEKVLQVPAYCKESMRNIPVIKETDLVVVGGSSGAVAAAAAAAKAGSKVFLIAYMPYLGDDICGSYMYQIDKRKEQPQTAIARKIFQTEYDPREFYPNKSELKLLYEQQKAPTPLHVKTVLETELIENDVTFLYSSYVTNVLTDTDGNVGGVVIANRSGRQAIKCKAIIDATTNATVAELFDAKFTPFTAGEQAFTFSVVGNSPKEHSAISKMEIMPFTASSNHKEYPITQYTFNYPLKDKSYRSIMNAEQFIRDITWDANQVDSADLLWYIPSWHVIAEENFDTIQSMESIKEEPFIPTFSSYEPGDVNTIASPHSLPKGVFTCKGIKNIWILGPCAAVPREVAAWLIRPVNNMTAGEIMGEYIAENIAEISAAQSVSVKPNQAKGPNLGSIQEILTPLRPNWDKGYVKSDESSLPVWGEYDVIVVGGGTAGAPAGISASRHQAKTLVLEYLHGLGGLTTTGFIGRYWDGYRAGFTAEIDQGVRNMAPTDHPRQMKSEVQFLADWKMEWFRRQLRKNKADLWYGILGCGALVRDHKVAGVVIATPFGRGVVLGNIIIDSTGSADIAIAANAQYEYTGKDTIAIQGAGLSRFELNDYYNNTDWTLVDDTDILDISRLYIQGKSKYTGCYDMGKLPQTRERRRIVGDYTISVYDVINQRRYADTISYHKSSFDTHGMTIDPFFTLNPPGKRHVIYDADVPLRALLPQGIESILVTGLGVSAHRDAMPVIRMQPCLQNQGYSVGYLASQAVKEKKPLREINIKKVQKHLVEKGILPQRVLSDRDFKVYTDKEFLQAAETVTDHYKGLEILLTNREKCLQVITQKIKRSLNENDRIICASILCILGNREYATLLVNKIRSYKEWDQGWHYTASDQFGECMSRLDSMIIALGNTKDKSVLPVILEKARLLRLEDHFSHYRAIAMACETIQSNDASPVLSQLLKQEGLRFNELADYKEAKNKVVPYIYDVSYRDKILKEIHLAKSLYLCGDINHTAKKVLLRYANGLEGHYARFAKEVLETKQHI